jgi:cytochrome d ubiquinol oxidase subunit II
MSVVSILVPFVLAYIVYVWRKMNAKPLTPTDLSSDSHSY